MPNKESQVVYELLSGYFYDQSIFTGTISIEFYISMTYDANITPYYSARIISAFFSYENTAAEGWDETCLNGSTDGLPDRDPDNRFNITHVGYFDGSENSAKPQVTLLDQQMIPMLLHQITFLTFAMERHWTYHGPCLMKMVSFIRTMVRI